RHNEDGRYYVALPWIDEEKRLPSNRIVAEKRLLNSTAKLDKINMYQQYDQAFHDWEEEGIIEEVEDDKKECCFYLPHRAVIKLESKTTPVRPVFDASVKFQRNPSLNESLY